MNDKTLTPTLSKRIGMALIMLFAVNSNAQVVEAGAPIGDLAIFGKNTSSLVQELQFSPEILKLEDAIVYFQSGVQVPESGLEQGYSFCALLLKGGANQRETQMRLEQGELKIALSEEGVEQTIIFKSPETSKSAVAVLMCQYFETEVMTLGVVKDAFGVYLEKANWTKR